MGHTLELKANCAEVEAHLLVESFECGFLRVFIGVYCEQVVNYVVIELCEAGLFGQSILLRKSIETFLYLILFREVEQPNQVLGSLQDKPIHLLFTLIV